MRFANYTSKPFLARLRDDPLASISRTDITKQTLVRYQKWDQIFKTFMILHAHT